MKPKKFRLSTSRLSALFVAIFAVGIATLLTTVYILTARVLDHEVDVVIQAEVNGLIDDYRRGGVLQLIETLHRRADNWGRTGAVYLLVDPQGRRIAGNIAGWPRQISAAASGSSSRSTPASTAASSPTRCARRFSVCLPGARCWSAPTSWSASGSHRDCVRQCCGAPDCAWRSPYWSLTSTASACVDVLPR